MKVVGDGSDQEEIFDELILKHCLPHDSVRLQNIPYLTPPYVRDPQLFRERYVNVDLQNCTLNCDDQPGTISFQENGDTEMVSGSGDGAEQTEKIFGVPKEDVETLLSFGRGDMEVDLTQEDVDGSSCSLNVNMSLRCIEGDEKLDGVEEVCSDGMTQGVGASGASVKGKGKLPSWMTEGRDSSSSTVNMSERCGEQENEKLNFVQEVRSHGVREVVVEVLRGVPSSMRQGGDKCVGEDVRSADLTESII